MKRNNKTCRVDGRSLLRLKSVDEISKSILSSASYSEAVRNLGLDVKTVYLNTLREIAKDNKISVEHFNRGKNNRRKSIYDSEKFFELLVEDSPLDQATLKKGLIFHRLIEHKCSECTVIDEYNGKSITLQLDHVNGISNDNRPSNLRWMCPNCHSQSDTFAGRNARTRIVRYCACGARISNANKSGSCASCFDYSTMYKSYRRDNRFEVSKEELEVLVKEKPMTEIGKMFGVSDNAIKKRCVKLGIELKPMRGHWRKLETGKI